MVGFEILSFAFVLDDRLFDQKPDQAPDQSAAQADCDNYYWLHCVYSIFSVLFVRSASGVLNSSHKRSAVGLTMP